jgi:hypothetical protein
MNHNNNSNTSKAIRNSMLDGDYEEEVDDDNDDRSNYIKSNTSNDTSNTNENSINDKNVVIPKETKKNDFSTTSSNTSVVATTTGYVPHHLTPIKTKLPIMIRFKPPSNTKLNSTTTGTATTPSSKRADIAANPTTKITTIPTIVTTMMTKTLEKNTKIMNENDITNEPKIHIPNSTTTNTGTNGTIATTCMDDIQQQKYNYKKNGPNGPGSTINTINNRNTGSTTNYVNVDHDTTNIDNSNPKKKWKKEIGKVYKIDIFKFLFIIFLFFFKLVFFFGLFGFFVVVI